MAARRREGPPDLVEPGFEMRHKKLMDVWKKLELTRCQDVVTENGAEYTDAEVLSYFDKKYESSSKGDYYVPGRLPLKPATILKDYRAIVRAVPHALHDALRGMDDELWRYSEQARRAMRQMGWRGGGLGAQGQGREAPVRAADGQTNTHGLGFGGRKKRTPGAATNSEKLRGYVEAHGDTTFMYPCPKGVHMAQLSVKGKPHYSRCPLAFRRDVDWSDLREVVKWKGTIVGIAESVFPHPEEWRLGRIDKELDRVDVRDLTRAISEPALVQPSCLQAWAGRIGELPRDIGERYNNSFLTPKDWHSHFKNILHRAMWVKGHDPAPISGCRVCKLVRENIQHFVSCEKISVIFTQWKKLQEENVIAAHLELKTLGDRERFYLFALTPNGARIAQGWLNLHLILWKYLIFQLVQVETEDARFSPSAVWQAAWSRFEKRAKAKSEAAYSAILLADSRGVPPPDMTKRAKAMEPIATFDPLGRLVWNADIKQAIDKLING